MRLTLQVVFQTRNLTFRAVYAGEVRFHGAAILESGVGPVVAEVDEEEC